MKNNKNKMIAVVCIALAVVILAAVLIWRLTGSEPQPTDPTGSPTQTTGQDPTGGEPTGSAPTKPETDPSSGTTVPTDPTLEPPQPSMNPTEPSTEPDPDFVEPTFETEPGPAEPEYTAPETDPTEPSAMPSEPPTQPTEPAPTEPEYTYPTDPDTGEVIPVEPPEEGTAPPIVDLPDVDPEVDIGDYTASTITYEVWSTWTPEQRQAFYASFDWSKLSPEENYHFEIETIYGGYDGCDVEGCYCCSEHHHQQIQERMAKGCYYCGRTDCPSFLYRGKDGFTETNVEVCPAYNEKNDPSKYCQECGCKSSAPWISGETYCIKVNRDQECPWCGEMRYVGQCHNCVKP